MKQYKPATNFYRISSATNEQFRVRRSISCEFNGSPSFNQSESLTSHGTSNDSQRQFVSQKRKRNTENTFSRRSPDESMKHATIQKSSSAPDNTSPWHLRKSFSVR